MPPSWRTGETIVCNGCPQHITSPITFRGSPGARAGDYCQKCVARILAYEMCGVKPSVVN